MLEYPRSAIVGLSLVLKFGLDPIYSFGDIAIFIFCRFGLKLPIHTDYLGEGVGTYFPKMWSPTNSQKDHPCAEIRRLSHRSSGFTWAQDRQKR